MSRPIQGVLLLLLFPCVLFFAASAWAVKPACGDGKCTGGETAASCPGDCSSASFCGDRVCDEDQTESCPQDCGVPPPSHLLFVVELLEIE
jgi:hypothetical protein